jgi:hypothetical protein
VRSVDLGPATVVVNYRNGRVETLIGPAAQWWNTATTTGHADIPGPLDRPAEQTLLGQLVTAGLIVPASHPQSGPPVPSGPRWQPSWGTQETPAGRTKPARVPLGTTVGASVALAVVLGVLAIGRTHRRTARLVWLLTTAANRTTRPATAEHARRAVHAVRRAGLIAPRACLLIPGSGAGDHDRARE